MISASKWKSRKHRRRSLDESSRVFLLPISDCIRRKEKFHGKKTDGYASVNSDHFENGVWIRHTCTRYSSQLACQTNDLMTSKNIAQQMYERAVKACNEYGSKWTHRKHQMNDHMECNECNNDPVEPRFEFGFCQFHSKENRHNCEKWNKILIWLAK